MLAEAILQWSTPAGETAVMPARIEDTLTVIGQLVD